MKYIIAHVGPPKTATTALQYYYKNIDLAQYDSKFIGCFQPRRYHNSNGDNSLIRKIYMYAKSPSKDLKNYIIKELDKIFETYDTIVLSEEMLLCSENWKYRMNNFYDLIEKYEHTIIICLRDIRKALPSYYGEVYNSLKINYQKEWNEFERSEHRYLYNFDAINSSLCEKFNIKYIVFDKLVSNECTIRNILPGISDEKSYVKVVKQNKKKRKYNQNHAEIELSIDLHKRQKMVRFILTLLGKMRLNKINSYIKNYLIVKKTVNIQLSDETLKIHDSNVFFLKQLNR